MTAARDTMKEPKSTGRRIRRKSSGRFAGKCAANGRSATILIDTKRRLQIINRFEFGLFAPLKSFFPLFVTVAGKPPSEKRFL